MGQITLLKQPHQQQQKFINSLAKEQLYGGAKRGGKSVALCQKAILLSYFFPGNRGGLFRKDYTDLLDTTLTEFWKVCPPELLDSTYGNNGHHKGERCIRLRTIDPKFTSDIIYRGLGGPEDFEKAKSLTLGWFGIDEPSELDFEVYKQLRAQLTWQLPNQKRPPYMALLASNPEPGWVKDRFIESRLEGCEFIPALPRQNPHLPPGWENDLRGTYDQEWIEKYLDGSWEVTEGSVFPELDERVHVIEPLPYSFTQGLALVGALDHATTGITAFIVAGIDVDGNIFVLHEHYEADKLVSWHSREIKALMELYAPTLPPESIRQGMKQQKFRYLLIDPSTQARTQQGNNQLQSVADVYRECGLPVVPAWNALEAGLQRMKEYLHVNPLHLHPMTGTPGSPRMYIVRKNCRNLWKEMRDLKKEVMASGQIRFTGKDHACDCVRYIVNSQPKPAETSARDDRNMPIQDQFMRRAHGKWAKKFAGVDGSKNEWWAGLTGSVQ